MPFEFLYTFFGLEEIWFELTGLEVIWLKFFYKFIPRNNSVQKKFELFSYKNFILATINIPRTTSKFNTEDDDFMKSFLKNQNVSVKIFISSSHVTDHIMFFLKQKHSLLLFDTSMKSVFIKLSEI